MKAQRKCAECGNFAGMVGGLGKCRFGGGYDSLVFADNAACKVFLPKEQPVVRKEPQYGDAPFCGDFPKCNNAEGCDYCAEFEKWVCLCAE